MLLTEENLVRQLRAQGHRPNKGESNPDFFRRITHLALEEKSVTRIEGLEPFQYLAKLYLYSNQISKIENLDFALHLEGLFLQDNQITKIENLTHMASLRRLNLAKNRICVLEGLEHCPRLEELSLGHQNLSATPLPALQLSPMTLESLASSLVHLDLSGNVLANPGALIILSGLSVLEISNCGIDELETLVGIVDAMPELTILNAAGNPAATGAKYRETLIVHGENLVTLDSKDLTRNELTYLKRYDAKKKGQFVARGPTSTGPRKQAGSQQPVLRLEPSVTHLGGTSK